MPSESVLIYLISTNQHRLSRRHVALSVIDSGIQYSTSTVPLHLHSVTVDGTCAHEECDR